VSATRASDERCAVLDVRKHSELDETTTEVA